MKNQYSGVQGQELLIETQKKPLKIWSMAKCPICQTKFDICLVKWVSNSPQCPTCKNIL